MQSRDKSLIWQHSPKVGKKKKEEEILNIIVHSKGNFKIWKI